MVEEEMHLHENILFELDPDPNVKVKQNVAQFPLHHVIYAPAKFAVATSNDLGEYAFTRILTEGPTDGRWTDCF